MRKLVLIGLTVTAVFAVAAVAVAQYTVAPATVTVTGSITPTSAKKGKTTSGSTLIKFDVNKESRSTLSKITYTTPAGIKISGAGFKKCALKTLDDPAKGEAACPKGSKVGTGASTALLIQPNGTETELDFAVNVYVADKNLLVLSLKQTNGTKTITANFPAAIAGRNISFAIPQNLQSPAPQLYSYVTSVTANLGPATAKKTIKKKKTVRRHGKKKKITVKIKKKYFLVTRTGCSGNQDVINVELGLANNPNPPTQNPITGTTSLPCSK